MKRKTYLILIWSITLCVIVISSTVTFVQTKGLFAQVWNQIAEKLEENFDFNLKFVSKNDDWNSNDNTDSDFSGKKEFETNLSLGCHKVRCSLNPNKKEWNSWRSTSCWNKGLTKDTDERIKKQSETFHSRVENGEIKIQGHKHSIETKEILSKKRSEYLASAENAG